MNPKEMMTEQIKNHFSKEWGFRPMIYKEQIEFWFKPMKSRIKGRIDLDKCEISYSIYNNSYYYEYVDNTEDMAKNFFLSLISFYPNNLDDRCEEFTDYLESWNNDRTKNNKRYRQLMGE